MNIVLDIIVEIMNYIFSIYRGYLAQKPTTSFPNK